MSVTKNHKMIERKLVRESEVAAWKTKLVNGSRVAVIGGGPRGAKQMRWGSFDGYLLELAAKKGAKHISARVETIDWQEGRPKVNTRTSGVQVYDLVVVAAGVNSAILKRLEQSQSHYKAPKATKTISD